MVYDNVGHISADQSDDLCRIATGFGYNTRTLFSTKALGLKKGEFSKSGDSYTCLKPNENLTSWIEFDDLEFVAV